jgi:uncharacterized protein YceK
MQKLLVIIIGSMLISGCASLITENGKTVQVLTSNNQKAEIRVDGQKRTVPAALVFVKDGKDKIITTEDPACQEQTVVKKKIEGAFWGNIIFGGLIGSTTDSVGDKMWTYDDTVTIICNE